MASAVAYFSTNTDLGLVNALNQSLNLYLPLNAPNGKSLFIKDATGNSFKSTITVLTQGSDTFEDGSIQQLINTPYESIQLAYTTTSNKWYITGGTMFNTLSVSTLRTQAISTISISSLTASFSTLKTVDQRLQSTVGTLNSVSSLLYYNNVMVSAGLRFAPSQVLNRYNSNVFRPNYITGLNLWLDASDLTTLFQDKPGTAPVTATGQSVNLWKDKSSSSNNAVTTTTATYNNPAVVNYNSLNGLPVLTFAGINGYDVTPSKVPYGANSATYFYVCNSTSSAGEQTVMFTNQYGNGAGRRHHLAGGGSSFIADLTNSYFTQDNTSFFNTYNTASIILNNFENGWVNGNPFNITNNIPISLVGGAFSATIGYLDIYPLFGNIAEIIIYNYDLPIFQRIQVEGYLAWKWGLQTKLPSNHPYRYYSP